MKKRCIGLLLSVFFLSTTYFCSPTQAASMLKIGVDAPPATMDPLASSSDATWAVLANVFGTLYSMEGPEAVLTPDLATSYERLDALTWKFYLRKGVTFHNGSPFTAADVKYTFERMKQPKCCSQRMKDGKQIASITIIDDYTVVIKTIKLLSNFVKLQNTYFIMDKETSENRDLGDISIRPVGTGPYVLKEWKKGSHLTFEAFDKYWKGAPAIKTVKVHPIKEASTRFAAIISGHIDLLSGIPVELYDKVVNNPMLDIASVPGRRPIFMPMSNKPGTPMADIRVRQAINMAVDVDEIIKKLHRGLAEPISQAADPAMIGYNPDIKRFPYNPEKAKQLLKAAGYADGFEITVAGPNDRYLQDEKVCEAVVKYLTKVGIKAKLNVMPKAAYWPLVQNGKFDIYMIGWLSNSFDWGENYNYLMHTFDKDAGTGSWNGARFSNPQIDEKYHEATVIVDPDERHNALQEVNREIMADAWALPLYLGVDTYALRKDKGIKYQPRPDRWIIYRDITMK